jgi:hypothetical protein
MTFDFNDGSRPSHLELARRATGESQGEVPPEFQKALDAAKSRVHPFDWEILSKHAARLETEGTRVPAKRRLWLWSLVPTLVAAVALLVLAPTGLESSTRTKGGAFLIPHVTYHVQRGTDVFPEGALGAVRAGDRVLFTIDPAAHKGLVLLSVDGRGTWTTYYPTEGDRPAPIAPRPQELPSSIELDDAPGPEVFVAFFGVSSVGEARTLAVDAFQRGGAEGLRDLARSRDDVEVSVLRKE